MRTIGPPGNRLNSRSRLACASAWTLLFSSSVSKYAALVSTTTSASSRVVISSRTRADLGELEHPGNEENIVYVFWGQFELRGRRHPPHADVIGVLSGKVKDAAAFHFELSQGEPTADQQRKQQRNCRLAGPRGRGE